MDVSGYWEDSQFDSIVEFDDSMNPFVKDSLMDDDDDVALLIEKEGGVGGRKNMEDDAGMIVQDTYDRYELVDEVVGVIKEEAVVDVVKEEAVVGVVKEEAVVVIEEVEEAFVIIKAEKTEELQPKDEVIEIIVIPDDIDIITISDDEACDEEKVLHSPMVKEDGNEVVKASRDFDLNKLPIEGMFKSVDPEREESFKQMLRILLPDFY